MSSMMIQNLFPSPIAVIDNEQSSSINASLKKLFLEREKNKEQYKNANPPPTVRKNIFDSEMNLFDDPQPDIQKLHHYIMNNLYQFIGELNGYSPSQLQKLRVRTNAWFHITRDGGYISHIIIRYLLGAGCIMWMLGVKLRVIKVITGF